LYHLQHEVSRLWAVWVSAETVFLTYLVGARIQSLCRLFGPQLTVRSIYSKRVVFSLVVTMISLFQVLVLGLYPTSQVGPHGFTTARTILVLIGLSRENVDLRPRSVRC
jgi:hypothetical protein